MNYKTYRKLEDCMPYRLNQLSESIVLFAHQKTRSICTVSLLRDNASKYADCLQPSKS